MISVQMDYKSNIFHATDRYMSQRHETERTYDWLKLAKTNVLFKKNKSNSVSF